MTAITKILQKEERKKKQKIIRYNKISKNRKRNENISCIFVQNRGVKKME